VLLTPDDLHIDIRVDETGQTTLENAILKAQAYCALTHLPTLAIDGGLRVERFPAEKQPGARVKRIQGDKDNHDVLAYYIRELEKIGGESPCTWVGSLALAFPDHRLITETYETQSILTAKARGAAIPGIDLSPITINPLTGRYYSEIRWDEHPDVEKIQRFLQKSIGAVR
jgi:XTP/dITP diphosphohydrolase